MIDAVSSVYAFLVVFLFLYDFFPHRKRAVIYKFYSFLKASKKAKINSFVAVFSGQYCLLLLYKNDTNFVKFDNNFALKIEFCEENFTPILPNNEIFGGASVEREYAFNGAQLFAKWEKSGLHITIKAPFETFVRVYFKKKGRILLKKQRTKCGFWVFIGAKKWGLFVDGVEAKSFNQNDCFGFVVRADGICNFCVKFENFNFVPILSKLKINLLKQQFGLPNFDGLVPNFDMLFFNNQPLKQKFARDFLTRAKYDFLPVLSMETAQISGFCFETRQKEASISLSEFGFSKFLKVSKRLNQLCVFDALTKLKVVFCFESPVCFFRLENCLGNIVLFVRTTINASFCVSVFDCNLSLLKRKLKFNGNKNFIKKLNLDEKSNIEQMFNLLNKAVLMGNLSLKKTFVVNLNFLVFSLRQQKAVANLVLSLVTTAGKTELLKSPVICKLLLKNCNYKNIDEFDFVFVNKLLPFVKNQRLQAHFNSVLADFRPTKFNSFEGVFGYELGLKVCSCRENPYIKICEHFCCDCRFSALILNKKVDFKFGANHLVVCNEQKFFGNSTIFYSKKML